MLDPTSRLPGPHPLGEGACGVPKEGLEPSLPCGKRILNPSRLPFRHFGLLAGSVRTPPTFRYAEPRAALRDAAARRTMLRRPPDPMELVSHDAQPVGQHLSLGAPLQRPGDDL